MPPKKGMFRAIKVKAKSGRGGLDAEDTWAKIMKNGQHESLLEQFNAASEEDQEAAKGYLNDIQDEFGDLFYTSKADAELGWTECESDSVKDKITNFIKEHLLPEDEPEKEE